MPRETINRIETFNKDGSVTVVERPMTAEELVLQEDIEKVDDYKINENPTSKETTDVVKILLGST